MHTPYELVSRYVVRPLRILVACRLVELGVSQHRAAKLLGVSQAAVNKYLSMRDDALRQLMDAGLGEGEVGALADSLAYYLADGRPEEYLRLLMVAVNAWLTQGRLCRLHRIVDEDVPKGCRVCMEFSYTMLKDPVVEGVEKALETLLGEPAFAELIPEVHSNIVECRPGARSIYEVVGVPGRITRIGRKPAAYARPSYGASRHLAKILLEVHSRRPEIRSLINIRFSEEAERMLVEEGVAIATISGEASERNIAEAFGRSAWAVAHLGGHGIEPIIYVAGVDSIRLASLITKIARRIADRRAGK